MKRLLAGSLLFLGCWGGSAFAQTATIENLGFIDPTNQTTSARTVSDNGLVVSGESHTNTPAASRRHIFRYTPPGPIQNLGAIDTVSASVWASGRGLSADGSVLVGYSETSGFPFPQRGFRRDSSGVLTQLPPATGTDSWANAVSDEGFTVVGVSGTGAGAGFMDGYNAASRATRWQNGTPVNLGTISNVLGLSFATAVSQDGSVIVGRSFNGAQNHACRFIVGQPVADLGTIQNINGASQANDVTPNGAIIVGNSISLGALTHAAIFPGPGGPATDLGTVDNVVGASSANCVNIDGTVIGGLSVNNARPGGNAALWINNQPRQLWHLLTADYGVTPTGWNDFDEITDVSANGSVLVGRGTLTGGLEGSFRIVLTPNTPPTVSPLTATTVECNGTQNLVTLQTTVSDPNAGDSLQVSWFVNGTNQQTSTAAPGSTVPFTFNYPDGASTVTVSVTDNKSAPVTSSTTVTVTDTKSPIVVVASELTRRVDRGETFATIALNPPSVSDVCDPSPVVTNNAPANNRYPIGTTNVVWTVKDKAGNVGTATQKIIVENRAPSANAGANIVRASKKKRTTVQLNGSRSRDPDKHDLTYLWSATKTKIADPKSVRTSGRFKVGVTRVTLTVTDEGGAKSSDTMIVRIKKARTARTSASQADSAIRTAYANSASSGGAGAQAATGAYFLGALAGDDVNVNGDASTSEQLDYATLRIQQSNLSALAASQAYESYLAGADENALVASLYASYAAAAAQRDLASEETVDVLVSEITKE